MRRSTASAIAAFLLLCSVMAAFGAEIGLTVMYGDCNHGICVDITATTEGARAWYYVLDQATGEFLIAPTVVALPVGAIAMDSRATKATLTLGAIHLTWTSTGNLFATEDSDLIQTSFGVTSRSSWRRISNRAQVVGTLDGIAVDSTRPGIVNDLGAGEIRRFTRRDK